MRDGTVYVNSEKESVQRIVTKAIRYEYHNGNSGEAEIANLLSLRRANGFCPAARNHHEERLAGGVGPTIAELTVKVNEQAEFILKQQGRIKNLNSEP